MTSKQTTNKYDNDTIKEYENMLTLSQWIEWKRLQKIEREFAANVGYDLDYGRYWETMTIQELREDQS